MGTDQILKDLLQCYVGLRRSEVVENLTQALPVGSRQKCDKSCLIKKFRTWGGRGRLSSPGSIVKSYLKKPLPPTKGNVKKLLPFSL